MDKDQIISLARDFTEQSPLNLIPPGKALRPHLAGLRLYGQPLLAFGRADDPIFDRLRQKEVVGPHHLSPRDWLPEGRTVMAFFVPFSPEVRAANARDFDWPAAEWLHGRIEGQDFIRELSAVLQLALKQAGHPSLSPLLDPRLQAVNYEEGNPMSFNSNWSERHAAHICGLGTFSLSRGLITEKGMAGRFGTVITSLPLEPDPRRYLEYDEYCTKCGACVGRCPAGAISLENGKEQKPCFDFQFRVLQKEKPYFGCGKCQVGVPCEDRRPRPTGA